MKFKKILMMDSRPRETDGITEGDLHGCSSQSKWEVWAQGSLKDTSKNFEMRYIDASKISFGSTIWGPDGLRIA
jgi:hypothetical protein